jgi:hypothetical protein
MVVFKLCTVSGCSISLIVLRYVGRLRAPVVMLPAWSVIQVDIISYLLQIILTLFHCSVTECLEECV